MAEVPRGDERLVPDGFEIRGPRADEIERLIDIDLALPEHQQRSPVFGGIAAADSRAVACRVAAHAGRREERILIGAFEGQAVACWTHCAGRAFSEHRGPARPDLCCYLGFASTLPEFRGTGIGVALTDAAFAWQLARGTHAMVTDWRVTNLLSSRFWPRRGFRISFLRLYRSIP